MAIPICDHVCRLDLEIREELGRVLFRRERSSTHGGIALLPLLSIEVRIIRADRRKLLGDLGDP